LKPFIENCRQTAPYGSLVTILTAYRKLPVLHPILLLPTPYDLPHDWHTIVRYDCWRWS